jgi:hypothetical protein
VARSRHKNAVERNRGTTPYGILIQRGRLRKRFRGSVDRRPSILGGGRRGENQGLARSRGRQQGGAAVSPGRLPRDGDTGAQRNRRQDVLRGWEREKSGKSLVSSWGSPWRSGEGADHDQQTLLAGRTGLTRSEGGSPGGGRRALRWRGGWRCGRDMPGQPALELVQERPMDGTPQPIVADFVEPLR